MTMRTFLTLIAVFVLTGSSSLATAADVDCAGCVDSDELAPRAVLKRHLAPAAVGTNKIEREAVTRAKLADGAVGYDKLDVGLRGRLGPDGGQPMTRLVDANGVLVGTVAGIYLAEPGMGAGDYVLVWVDVGDQPVLLRLANDRLGGAGFEGEHLGYSSSDCSGAPYAPAVQPGPLAELRSYGVTPDGRVWKAVPGTVEKRFVWSMLAKATGRCIPTVRKDLTLLTEEVGQLPEFESPFALVYE
jgi:hypothetical protein